MKNQEPRALVTYSKNSLYTSFLLCMIKQTHIISTINQQEKICIRKKKLHSFIVINISIQKIFSIIGVVTPLSSHSWRMENGDVARSP